MVAACHNSKDNVTISGPSKSVAEFVKACKAEGIFAKEVNSSGFAFHSKYIAGAEPKLRKCLKKVSNVYLNLILITRSQIYILLKSLKFNFYVV